MKVENLNEPNEPNGMTPLHAAVRFGHTGIVKILADKVENPNAPLPNGWTLLHAAIRSGHTEIVNILADKVLA